MIGGLAALALGMGIGRFAMTPMLPFMISDDAVSVTGGGWLATLHFAGYLAGALVAVRIPVRPIVLLPASMAVIVLSTLTMGLSGEFAVWGVSRVAAGLASAWILVAVSRVLVAGLSEESRSVGQGLIFSGVGAGVALAGLMCLLFGETGTSSRNGWLLLGLTGAGLAVLSWAAARKSFSASGPAERSAHGQRVRLDWRAVVAYGMAGLGYVIPATYLPLLAQQIIAEPALFGLAWPVFGAAAALSTVLAARLFDRMGNRMVWTGAQVMMAIGVLLPVLVDGLASVIVAGLFVGGTFMVVTMAGVREAHRMAPPADVARHIAALTASFAAGQMAGPVLAGYTFDVTGDFDGPLVLAAILLAGTALLLLREQPPAAGQS
jgi:MFS family permease